MHFFLSSLFEIKTEDQLLCNYTAKASSLAAFFQILARTERVPPAEAIQEQDKMT